MSRRVWAILGAIGVVLLALIWVASRLDVFANSEDLDRRAEALDAGVPEDWPFDVPDASVPDGGAPDGGAGEPQEENVFAAIGGTATLGLRHFTMHDKQGRQVLRIKKLTGEVDLDQLRRGVYRVAGATIRGAEITLYRDESGALTITTSLRERPPLVSDALYVPPEEPPKGEDWIIDIGPVNVRDAILTLGFTASPVSFYIESAKAIVRQTAGDEAPKIYLHEVQGKMLEPDPLPRPVRIAHASGIVRLEGSPMVELTARACVGNDELRVHAVVPARKKTVRLTVDSSGIGGALGRMGLRIAANRKDELHFEKGPVKIEAGPGCEYEPGERRELKDEGDEEATLDDPDTSHEERVDARRENREERQDARQDEEQGDE